MDLRDIVNRTEELVVELRRDLHRIPETAYTEEMTSAAVARFLEREGLRVTRGLARRGVMGLLDTGRPGPVLMIRADMDGLPIEEATDLPFASIHPGLMHACGHDGHMAMVLGAVKVFKEIRFALSGAVKFVFQPAEEWPGGAKAMIDDGVMDDPKVDFSVGCHLWPAIPEGTIGVKPGPMMAAMDRFVIRILGRGGHGAMPHLCVDALEVGTQVVGALQRLVSRKLDPFTPTVLTIGTFHAGEAFNIIPGMAEISGTTRTFDEDIWASWPERIDRVVKGVCESMGADYELEFRQGYPPLVNDEFMAGRVAVHAGEVVGLDRVIAPASSMAGEDMSYFLRQSKGAFFFLGVGREGASPLHSPTFDFNEAVLASGVEVYARVGLDLLKGR